MLGSLRPHVHLRLLRERQARVAKDENGEKQFSPSSSRYSDGCQSISDSFNHVVADKSMSESCHVLIELLSEKKIL